MELLLSNRDNLVRKADERRDFLTNFGGILSIICDSPPKLIFVNGLSPFDIALPWLVFETERGEEIAIAWNSTNQGDSKSPWSELLKVGSAIQSSQLNYISNIRHRFTQALPKLQRSIEMAGVDTEPRGFFIAGDTTISALSADSILPGVPKITFKHKIIMPINRSTSLKGISLVRSLLYLFSEDLQMAWLAVKDEEFGLVIMEKAKMEDALKVNVKVILGEISLSLDEVMALAPGTKLVLGCPNPTIVSIELGDQVWSKGSLKWTENNLELEIIPNETISDNSRL